MEGLSIYFTRRHASIQIDEEDGARHATGRTMPKAIANMLTEDRDMLVRFCKAVIECTDGNCKRLEEW